ncbi:polycomb group RING finger protein 2-like [Caloenas nicobarica]|uniref:polycomb group RING finger protein 2-like n=1 Tax=Caloenas nicobarica TaxID=187106 RepID=UPI0032B7FD1B
MATELDNRCPICLDSWEEASYVMPCLHQFCYPCILRWAESKPECPLCKRRILSVLHSVRADDDYAEHVITPSVPPSVLVRQADGAPSHPDTPDLPHPGAPQPQAVEEVPRATVGGLQPEEWALLFRHHPRLLDILLRWLQPRLRNILRNNWMEAAMAEDTVMTILTSYGVDEELLVSMLENFLQDSTTTFVQRFIRVAVQRCSREARRLLSQQEGLPNLPVPPPPLRYGTEELPGTSSAAVAGGSGSCPSAPIASPAEQEQPQEEAGEAVPRPSTSSGGRERSHGRPRRPPKRRAGSSEASPANKRPARPR